MRVRTRSELVIGVTALTLLASAALGRQQPDPNSPRYKGVTAMRDLIASSGDGPLLKFIEDKIAPTLKAQHPQDELLRMLKQVRADFAGAPWNGAAAEGPFSAQLMFGAGGAAGRNSLVFELEDKLPHRFIDFGYEAPRKNPADASADLPDLLRAYLDDRVARDKFSGAVLVAKDGRAVFKQAYGLASKRFNVPNRVDTKFNLGSMNKMFTGVAICQLAEQGKLAFDDLVIKHLPDYPNKEVAQKITIHQLLTHTSGLGSYWNRRYERDWKKIRTVEDLLVTFVKDPLQFEPGAQFGYSNAGPVVLGLIIERITGQTYYDYVREHIYKPCGMRNTDCYAMDTPVPNLAIGYTRMSSEGRRSDGPRRNNLFMHSIKGGPAGGGFSTVEDMLKFSTALQSHKLLGPELTETLLTGKVTMGPGMKYAYLFGDHRQNGHRAHGHNGGAPGISADFRFYPKLGYTVVVLANYDGAASAVARFARGIIERQPPTEPMQDQAADSGRRPYRIGVALEPGPDGLTVDYVVSDAPAEAAGMRSGDVLVSINGEPFGNDPVDQIDAALTSGDPVSFGVKRGNETLTIKITPERVGGAG